MKPLSFLRRCAPMVIIALSFSSAAPSLATGRYPVIGTVSPGAAVVNEPLTLVADVSDSAGTITSCNLYIDNDDKGGMTVANGQATRVWTFDASQVYTAFVFCRDSAGNFNSGANAAVWAQYGTGSGNPPPPTVEVPPFSNTTGNGSNATTSSSYYQPPAYVPPAPSAAPSLPLPTAIAKPNSLVKASLPSVYWYAANGKRYVYPNFATFKSWYSSFDDANAEIAKTTVLSDADLAKIPFGGNVTYRPGMRMIKIQTDPKVYAVSKYGVLHWITTEQVATALYGPNWNTQIDDVDDSFFFNYSVGSAISDANQFNVAQEQSAVPTPTENIK